MDDSTQIEDLNNRITELEQEKKQLLKLVSHDVKSPFNKLFALSNLLQLVSEDLNKEQLDYLNRMEWVIKEGLTVVRNLMDLRAIDNNSIELFFENVSIDSLLDESFKNYSKQIKAKKLRFSSKIDKVTTSSDKRSIERIFDNLVSNAVKFSPKESVINVNFSEVNKISTLSISTQSGPIPAKETTSLFKRGSPLSTRPTHGESALGNGLFIAQKYANALGGHIEFSQEGENATFSLSLIPTE